MDREGLYAIADRISANATAVVREVGDTGGPVDHVYHWATREYTRSMQLQIIADELVGLTRYFRGEAAPSRS